MSLWPAWGPVKLKYLGHSCPGWDSSLSLLRSANGTCPGYKEWDWVPNTRVFCHSPLVRYNSAVWGGSHPSWAHEFHLGCQYSWLVVSAVLPQVSKKNLMEIVKKLMTHVDKAEGTTYRDELLTKIIDICSQSNYQHITNFEWYISILVELTRLEGTRHGHLIAAQMLDVAIRVKAIRKFAVSQMSSLLDSAHLVASSTQRNGICEVLYAAAWICGEFSE